jgi:hypothetical protein
MDAPELEHVEVRVQPRDAVALDAAEIGGRENFRGERGVLRGDSEVLEDARGERP